FPCEHYNSSVLCDRRSPERVTNHPNGPRRGGYRHRTEAIILSGPLQRTIQMPTSRGTCCIAGGGPAGMMLGDLLARAGIEVLVLEKHADFLRDFRGDTVHPSTLETIHELGVLEEFLKRPHQEVIQVRARIGDKPIVLGNMSYLRTRCRFMALMP